jgi:hypothetical protein
MLEIRVLLCTLVLCAGAAHGQQCNADGGARVTRLEAEIKVLAETKKHGITTDELTALVAKQAQHKALAAACSSDENHAPARSAEQRAAAAAEENVEDEEEDEDEEEGEGGGKFDAATAAAAELSGDEREAVRSALETIASGEKNL